MKAPPHPYIVMAIAIVLPGMGQVINRQPMRGLIFLIFILLLGAFTLKTAPADVSFIGKVSGGLIVWAIAVVDAYKTARIRQTVFGYEPSPPQDET